MPEIISNSDSTDPRPWFDFRVSSDLWVDIFEANGLAAATWTNASEQAEQALTENSRHSLGLTSGKETETHVLAVATDGGLEFVPRSEEAGVYYAHLGWYDPETGTWEKLEFVE